MEEEIRIREDMRFGTARTEAFWEWLRCGIGAGARDIDETPFAVYATDFRKEHREDAERWVCTLVSDGSGRVNEERHPIRHYTDLAEVVDGLEGGLEGRIAQEIEECVVRGLIRAGEYGEAHRELAGAWTELALESAVMPGRVTLHAQSAKYAELLSGAGSDEVIGAWAEELALELEEGKLTEDPVLPKRIAKIMGREHQASWGSESVQRMHEVLDNEIRRGWKRWEERWEALAKEWQAKGGSEEAQDAIRERCRRIGEERTGAKGEEQDRIWCKTWYDDRALGMAARVRAGAVRAEDDVGDALWEVEERWSGQNPQTLLKPLWEDVIKQEVGSGDDARWQALAACALQA